MTRRETEQWAHSLGFELGPSGCLRERKKMRVSTLTIVVSRAESTTGEVVEYIVSSDEGPTFVVRTLEAALQDAKHILDFELAQSRFAGRES